MKELSPEWAELLAWFCAEASHPNPPPCLPIAVRGWFQSTGEIDRQACEQSLMDWLVTWSWPEMSETVQGLVHLRLSFALYGMLQAMNDGREPLRGDAQKRGTIHGLVFRNWEREQGAWLDHYARHWPSMRGMMSAEGN